MIWQPVASAMVGYFKRRRLTSSSLFGTYHTLFFNFWWSHFSKAMDNLTCVLRETDAMIRRISSKENRLRWIAVWMDHEWVAQSLSSVTWVADRKKVLLKLHSARVGRIQVHERKLCLRIFFQHQNCPNVTAIIFANGSSFLLRWLELGETFLGHEVV